MGRNACLVETAAPGWQAKCDFARGFIRIGITCLSHVEEKAALEFLLNQQNWL